MPCCRLETERLLLRPQETADIARMTPLLNDYDVAKNLVFVPHPYTEDDAKDFVTKAMENSARGEAYPFAITLKANGMLIGGCSLRLRNDGVFELGYWLGKSYWGQGYASEAAKRIVGFAFCELKAPMLRAGYFHDNPASERILKKLGAIPAGVEHLDCLARGHPVYCYRVVLDRENFGRKR